MPKHPLLEETAICAAIGAVVGVIGFTTLGADAPWWQILMLAGLTVIISLPVSSAWTRWRTRNTKQVPVPVKETTR